MKLKKTICIVLALLLALMPLGVCRAEGELSPPELTATRITLGCGETSPADDIALTFKSDAAFENAVTGVTVNGDDALFSITAGSIAIDSSAFPASGEYAVTVSATGYLPAEAKQLISPFAIVIEKGGEYVFSPVTFSATDAKWLAKVSEIRLTKTVPESESTYSASFFKGEEPNQYAAAFTVSDNTLTLGARCMVYGEKDTTGKKTAGVAAALIAEGYPEITVELGAPKAEGKISTIYPDTETNFLGGTLTLTLEYFDDDAEAVRAYAAALFAARLSSSELEIENVIDGGNGVISVLVNASRVISSGSKSITFYAEGYPAQSVTQTFREAEPAPKLYIDAALYPGEDVIISYSNEDQVYFPAWRAALTSIRIDDREKGEREIDPGDEKLILFDPDAKQFQLAGELFDSGGTIRFTAKGYSVQVVRYSMSEKKPLPVVYPQAGARVGRDVALSFTDNSAWRENISAVKVQGKTLKAAEYSISAGSLVLSGSLFGEDDTAYLIVIEAAGYEDCKLQQGFGSAESFNSFDIENAYSDLPFLYIVYNGEQRSISEKELYRLAAEQGNIGYTFSGYNTYPTWSKASYVVGPTLESVLEYVGVDIDALDGEQLVSIISGNDYFTARFTVDKLFRTPRYYFPNGQKGTGKFTGFTEDASCWAGKKEVPAVIELSYASGSIKVGQANPGEQQKDAFVKMLMSEKRPGTISISSDTAVKNELPTPSIASGSTVKAGEKLMFTSNAGRAKIYYTVSTNGLMPPAPTELDTMYNFSEWKRGENSYEFTAEPTIINVRVISRWGLDSDVLTLYYNGASAPVITGGWQKIGKNWIYGENGAALSGRQTLIGYQRGGKQGENEYFFNRDGSLYTGFKKWDGKWYFYYETGSRPASSVLGQMCKGFYVNSPSKGYLTDAERAGGREYRYYFNGDGTMFTGWYNSNLSYDKTGKWRYFTESGSGPETSRLGRMCRYGQLKCTGNGGGSYYYFFSQTGAMFMGKNSLGYFNEKGENPALDLLGARL